MTAPPEMPHVVSPIVDATFGLLPDSLLAQRSLAVIEHFDIPLPASNPRLLEMFKDRNRHANGASMTQMAWAGEFVGKWLTHASQLYRLTKHAELKATIQMAVDTLANDLKRRFSDNGVNLPFSKEKDCIYKLGTRRVMLNVIGNKLMVRMGGGFVDFLEFLETARF